MSILAMLALLAPLVLGLVLVESFDHFEAEKNRFAVEQRRCSQPQHDEYLQLQLRALPSIADREVDLNMIGIEQRRFVAAIHK